MRSLSKIKVWMLSGLLLVFTVGSLAAQQGGFYNGVRQGSRGYDDRYDRNYGDRYHRGDEYYQQPRQGGIGPGKGAAIGGAGGAALGAIFGGGLKGAIIGGAAGAGVGAIAGQANQNSRQRQYRDYRDYRR